MYPSRDDCRTRNGWTREKRAVSGKERHFLIHVESSLANKDCRLDALAVPFPRVTLRRNITDVPS